MAFSRAVSDMRAAAQAAEDAATLEAADAAAAAETLSVAEAAEAAEQAAAEASRVAELQAIAVANEQQARLEYKEALEALEAAKNIVETAAEIHRSAFDKVLSRQVCIYLGWADVFFWLPPLISSYQKPPGYPFFLVTPVAS